ncbi:serine/threonine protein kinase [Bifidobacterium dolichotidis]
MGRMNDMHALNLEPGDQVGGYTLVNRLGSGAMGSVWKVEDDGHQTYAMKILLDSLHEAQSDDEQRDQLTARERLRREAMALRRIHNPGVCSIVDMELDDSVAFIVTDLIDGRNLRDDVEANGRYVGHDLEHLASKLIDAVAAVHQAGIVHRDIKPTNVMVSTRGPVLVDFGIAMGAGEMHVTRTGLVMGTPGFIAPEIIDGAESDELTDWWSLASVLAFAATGRPVFGTKPMMAVLEREASGNANLAGLPPRTLEAFRAALQPDRTQRISPQQLLDAITQDAWQQQSWNDAQSGAMLPFEVEQNPRLAWRTEPKVPQPQRTRVMTQQMPSVGQTAVLDQTTRLQPPAAPADLDEQTTALTSAMPQAAAQPEPMAAMQASPAPEPVVTPEQIEAVRTTVLKRAAILPVAAMTALVALLGASVPTLALLIGYAMLWLICSLGCAAQTQIRREAKRGGLRKHSDAVKQTVSVPWYLVRGLVQAIPAWLISTAISVGLGALGSLVFSLPTAPMSLTFIANAGWPMPYDMPYTQTGAVLGISAGIGWLIAALVGGALLRIGAGWIATPNTAITSSPSLSQAEQLNGVGNDSVPASRKRTMALHTRILLGIWVVCIIAGLTVLVAHGMIDWMPLMMLSY